MINALIHPSTWIDWLILYLCIGGLGLALLGIKALLTMPSSFAQAITGAMGYKKPWKEKLEDYVGFALAMTLALIGWPAFLIWQAYELRREAKLESFYNLSDFKVAPKFLVSQVEISEAESQNFIYDPIGQTPNIPFGHLNQAWQIFVSNKPEGSVLQKFEILKGSKFGKYETEALATVRGYAWVVNREIAAEFITEEG